MKSVNYTEARRNLATLLNAVTDDQEPAVIHRAGHDPVVVIPLTEYETLTETEYLLRSPDNADALREAIADLDAGRAVVLDPHASKSVA